MFQTFFQRYSDNDRLYMGAGHTSSTFLMETVGGMTEKQMELLVYLTDEKKLTITEEMFNSCDIVNFNVGDVIVVG